jgi:hypothetical protein
VGITEWLEDTTPDRREVTICMDRRLVSELVAAKDRLKAASSEGMLGSTPEARAEVDRLAEEVRAKSKTLVFEGLGWGAWRELVAKHPPAPDQASTFAAAVRLGFMPHVLENIGYNAETFIPAAIAASCAEPGMSAHEANTLLRKAPAGILERLWAAVLEVNLGGGEDPFDGVAAVSAGAPASARK